MAGRASFTCARATTIWVRSWRCTRRSIASRSWCSAKPLTGFYRTGSCETGPEDVGLHTVCTRVDAEFLAFSRAAGNDLSTPVPAAGFPGLRPGDCWCLAERWKEAFEAGRAPRVRLTATHE